GGYSRPCRRRGSRQGAADGGRPCPTTYGTPILVRELRVSNLPSPHGPGKPREEDSAAGQAAPSEAAFKGGPHARLGPASGDAPRVRSVGNSSTLRGRAPHGGPPAR